VLVIIAIFYFINLIWVPVALITLAVVAQGVIWLAYWHARHIIPTATHAQGFIELQTNGGNKTIDVEVAVAPRKLELVIGWSAIVFLLIIEFVIVAALVVEMSS